MTLIFPTIQNEELLYSACARFQDLFRYPGGRRVAEALFSTREYTAILDLPTDLESFVDNLPPGHPYTSSRLIQEHTTLPYYAHFIAADRLSRIVDRMSRGGKGARVPAMLGAGSGRVPPPTHLRFCLACAAEDVARCGEGLWRRVHQLPGVFACPDHDTPLQRGPVRQRNLVGVFAYHPLRDWLSGDAVEEVQPEAPAGRLLWLAEQSQWLLRAMPRKLSPEQLLKRHRARVYKIGMLSASGRVRAAKVTGTLMMFWGQPLLERMQLDRYMNNSTALRWVHRQTRDNGRLPAGAPLRHLLLIGLYGVTAEQFLDDEPSTTLNRSSGSKVSECANPVCPNYLPSGERHVARKAYRTRGKSHRCARCGCEYKEYSPSANVKFILTGLLWEQALREAAVEGVGAAELGRRLGVSPQLALCHADRLGVWREAWGDRARADWNTFEQSVRELTERRRTEWLRVRSEHPEANRTELSRCNMGLHTWLRSNDNAWFLANQPTRNTPSSGGTILGVDWSQRDRELRTKVEAAVGRLLAPGAALVRITRASIGRDIGAQRLIMSQDERLPLTNRWVESVVETVDDFVRRRIGWHARECIRRGEILVFTDFFERCGIEWPKRHRWRGELETALDTIHEALALKPQLPRRAAEEQAAKPHRTHGTATVP
jgi:hypothetical protein